MSAFIKDPSLEKKLVRERLESLKWLSRGIDMRHASDLMSDVPIVNGCNALMRMQLQITMGFKSRNYQTNLWKDCKVE